MAKNYTGFTNVEAEEIKAKKIIAEETDLPSELPEYSAADADKVLSVDSEGNLTWKTLE